MATNEPDDPSFPDAEPAASLPEDSVLDLEDYIDMHKAVGNPTRYRILRLLLNEGALLRRKSRKHSESTTARSTTTSTNCRTPTSSGSGCEPNADGRGHTPTTPPRSTGEPHEFREMYTDASKKP